MATGGEKRSSPDVLCASKTSQKTPGIPPSARKTHHPPRRAPVASDPNSFMHLSSPTAHYIPWLGGFPGGKHREGDRGEVMAVTHDDLAVVRGRGLDVGGRRGLFLVIFSVLCGLASFILCLAAEATRSEATLVVLTSPREGRAYQCLYSGSGKTPLALAVGAFLALAVGMFTEHAHILITAGGPRPPALAAPHGGSPPSSKGLTWRACFFFITTWICFAVAEVILMVCIAAESGHLTNWRKPRSNCLVVRQGLYASAGVFSLTTVFFAAGLYLTALQAQVLHDDDQHMHPRVSEASAPRLPARARTLEGILQSQLLRQANGEPPSGEDRGNKTSTSI